MPYCQNFYLSNVSESEFKLLPYHTNIKRYIKLCEFGPLSVSLSRFNKIAPIYTLTTICIYSSHVIGDTDTHM